MSALTDLFTALANKIRSKTGGQETYTPLEMVSDGIDDVYDAGVAAGTPTLTGDASASDVKSGKTFYGSTLTKQTGTFAADSTNNSATATTSQETKSPASGKYFSSFTINPQQHSETYTPAANTSNNDMGAVHNKRYVNTSGMIVPSGTKSITSNGNVDVSSYSTANVNVPDPTLSGDAAVGNVLSGKTFYNNSLTKRTGNMTNNGAVAPSGLNCGGSYTIPAGYHNGSGVVTANSLASQTGVDSGKTAVTAAKMFSGYQGWVNGSKISGTYTAPTISNITPSNTSPVSMSSGSNYSPTASGYAIEFYDSENPSQYPQTPLGHYAGEMVKFESNGYIIDSYNSVTPSNSSPGSLSSGSIYKMGGAGYAISSYDNVTPTADGAYFSSGMKKMASSGYAYSEKPTGFEETTLWTNSAPTSNFSGNVTLSESISNFTYIAIDYRLSTSNTTSSRVIIPSADLLTYVGDNSIRGVLAMRTTSNAYRLFTCTSATVLDFQGAKNSSGTVVNNYCIPTYIKGLKFK